MITESDKKQLSEKGISEEQIERQLQQFRTGFPFLKLEGAAAVGSGILRVGEDEQKADIEAWERYKDNGHKVLKFVPASGAASRMFKDMFEFLDADYDMPQKEVEKKFFHGIHEFAFFSALDDACMVNEGRGVDALLDEGDYKAVVRQMLSEEGLNYGQLPKGLLQFHAYEEEIRTPLEEHLVEAAIYGASNGKAEVHFTVSPEHRPLFEQLVERVCANYEERFGVKFTIYFSEQKSSTDTLAANMDNTPFRTEDGRLLFRPGGHGALIENLGLHPADAIFVKNIDNVVPDHMKEITVRWKKVIGGILARTQEKVFGYLRLLDSGVYSHAQIEEMIHFVRHELFCRIPNLKDMEDAELVNMLRRKLNRPVRVCGVVENVGEPGGGPFWAENPDGSTSLQILESSQIDTNKPEYVRMFKEGTHFNPVDLVCGIMDYQGQPFDLQHFVDPATGFISYKSKNGRELKALELPGLWNGAMSDWNTLFVEVPLETFNPVKVVCDLLRKEHQ